MKRFMAGLAIGLFLGITGAALAADIMGGDGPAMGWTVTHHNATICNDPWLWVSQKHIQCR
ncbi:MAG: hypothetical protein ACHQK9_13250 [Reyranellales bacterium]